MDQDTFAKLATLNGDMLKSMSVEEILAIHPLIDVSQLVFRKARKTKPIKVRAVNTLLMDESIFAKVLLATLEGNQSLKANSFVCWGVDNDVWQQAEDKLHAKYDLKHVDPDGWIHCEPKPENATFVCEITPENCNPGPASGISVLGLWGDERVLGGEQVYLQYGVIGDYVMQNVDDPTDVYRCDRSRFDNTYEFEN